MKLIACLGNPGKKYSNNRHNVGFLTGEFIAQWYGVTALEKKFSSLCGSGTVENHKALMLFPQTYMNQSGIAVKAAIEYYDIAPENLIVIHDDIELPFKEVRTKFGGGHKGQNGVRSIIEHLETPDFFRIRVGVGRPPHPEMKVADYLLSDFLPEEQALFENIFSSAREQLVGIINRSKEN
jgi:PTH1 family peptidyl-tRNA hydrolase